MFTLMNTSIDGELNESPLSAIRDNGTLVLSITDKKMRLKKRNTEPVLMIAPMSLYGGDDEDVFLFSIPNYGCELMNIKELKANRFWMMGMTMNAANILVHEINALFK